MASVVPKVAVSERCELDRDKGSALAVAGDEKVRELDREDRLERGLDENGLELEMGEEGGVAIELLELLGELGVSWSV